MASPPSLTTFVIDSWPIMEWLQEREPATQAFDMLIERSLRGQVRLIMSRVNFGEVLYSCWKLKDVQHARLLADVEALPIEVVSVNDDLVIEAAHVKAICSASYADCFAAALALRFDAAVVTGDGEFRKLQHVEPKLRVEWVGA